MKSAFLPTFFLIAAVLALDFGVVAQIEESCPNLRASPSLRRDPMDNTPNVRDQLIRLCIKEQKKDFEELVERTEEIEKLSAELQSSFETNKSLSSEDLDKLERVENLIKKVRGELKASDDDDEDAEKPPSSMLEALSSLRSTAVSLAGEIKKTTRHSISLVAVQSSNSILKLVKFLRLRN